MRWILLSFLVITGLFWACGIGASSEVPHIEDVQASGDVVSRPGLRVLSREGEGPWRHKRHLMPLLGEEVTLKVRAKNPEQVRWYLIFADLTQTYQNANHPWEDEPYKWTGLDTIQYYRMELLPLRNQSEVQPLPLMGAAFSDIRRWFVHHGNRDWGLSLYNARTGTFWIQAEVDTEGRTMRSPGIEDIRSGNLSPSVLRISVRSQEGLLGYVEAAHNVPGVFGSVIAQSKHYLGADCADVLMAAWSKWKRKPLKKNYNVQMLVSRFRHVAEVQVKGGVADKAVRWGEQVQPGDFIAVSYGENNWKFHHIGALYRDENQNGILDGADSVLHAGPEALHTTTLATGSFDGRVVILRP